ncbi:peptide ABC transporter permease [Rhodococcus sp. 06-412-2C]|uniref:ABC transporter permease n=1 Tax=unclassified Rhodococcus (in: high G+C Gram-positive bacteria) TaxID=192944 RepID=UPI000B9B7962|nr:MULTISPECIES: ABC transporter permease [unclassified Rhodococcus (in: high G+C Gram-positive bacteria)]OZC90629.1 peptide ABC transporter permease [Rhodococcus sp. 06-412-2C]OZC98115.1 peptide ABC transporter permease [Rhodococcus sp. 06-412-2B]
MTTLDSAAPQDDTAVQPSHNARSIGTVLRWLRGHAVLAVAVTIFSIAAAWAVAPSLFTAFDPIAIDNTRKLLPPSGEHWFGTDLLGRDLFSRIVYGARASLLGAGLAVAVAVVAGSLLGSVAGWFGGALDSVVMRVIDVVLSIPEFLLAISIVVLYSATTGRAGLIPAALAVGVTSSAKFARLIRSEVLKVRTSSYVEAAVTSGATTFTILRRHVVPNSLAPTISLIAVQLGIAIIWIASLSFLGLGAQPPDPEWGLLVADGRQFIATRGWLTLYPALTIIAVVMSTNIISRHLQKRNAR